MRKRFLIVPVAVLILALSSIVFSQVDTTAVVAAWNVEGFEAISAEKAQRLARAIADLDAEVIALSEVNPDSVADQIVTALGALGADYQRTILDQTARQNLALLHKTGVTVSNATLIPGSDDDNPDLRKALAANVRIGRFDFIVIAVHLKSGRGDEERATRSRQAEVIASFINDATAGAEKDVLLIGDYNMRPEQDQENFSALNPDQFLRFISSEDLAGQISHISNCAPNRGSLLDGYAISRQHTTEYVHGSLRIFPLDRALQLNCVAYTRDVSDHLPVIARFRITRDDD